ncbi:hypothetical protein D3C81_2245240 [compost metagenome]
MISHKTDAFGADCRVLTAALAGFDDLDADVFAQRINDFAAQLGAKLQFASRKEFDTFMASDEPLTL